VTRIQQFDLAAGVLRALLWQHNRASNLRGLLERKQAWYDANVSQFWENWFRDVFDLRTANAFGCQVWARILGVQLAPALGTVADRPVFGFEKEGAGSNDNQNFERGNFGESGAAAVRLTVEQQRIILQLRYFQLVTRCAVPEINRFMRYIFRELGPVHVLDPGGMQPLIYVFGFTPDARLAFVLREYDLLPRPSTVGVGYIVTTRASFGFGATNENFERGTFLDNQL
jgi:hypothetical protein